MKFLFFLRNSQNKKQMKDGVTAEETAKIEALARRFESGGWDALKGAYNAQQEVVGLEKVYVLPEGGLYSIRFVLKGHYDRPLKTAQFEPVNIIH